MGHLGHIPVNQQVYLRILDLILTQQLPRGSRLDERQLVAEMGVSRTPLREAIARLVEKGLVEYRPYQGNFVRDFSEEEILGIFKVRRALEELAIREAIAHMTPELLTSLRTILEDLDAAVTRADVIGIGEADRLFHAAIAEGSQCGPLIEILNDLGSQIQIFRSVANQNPEVLQRTALQRPLILAAIESSDADTAARLLGEHIDYVRDSVLAEQSLHHHAEHPRAHVSRANGQAMPWSSQQ